MWQKPVTTSLALMLLLGGCAKNPPSSTDAGDVRDALAARYPATGVIREHDLQFEKGTPVVPVDLPALTEALPDVRFFVTRLRTGYYEYPELSVAVAFPDHGTPAIYYSPTYADSEPAFVRMLVRAKVADASRQRGVAEDIARLFAMITARGEIRARQFHGDTFTAELWHGDLYWRRVSIRFASGGVASVMLVNPHDAAGPPDRPPSVSVN